jgi:hypothetical protein
VIDAKPRYALKVEGVDPSGIFDVHGNLYVANEDPAAPWPPHNIKQLNAENGVDIAFHQGYAPAIRVYNPGLWSWYPTIQKAIDPAPTATNDAQRIRSIVMWAKSIDLLGTLRRPRAMSNGRSCTAFQRPKGQSNCT